MEPAPLRAILARAPGLVAHHLTLAARDASAPRLDAGILPALLALNLPRRTRAWLESPDYRLIDSDLQLIDTDRHGIITVLDPGYPPALALLPSAPAALYLRGNPAVLARPAITLVGAPHASAAGLETAYRFAADLTRAGLSIVSGLAEGIDTAAQHGARETAAGAIGVCTAGLDRIAPARSARLAAQIAERGCLVSLFAPRTPPRRYHFALRNQLLAACSAGVLVVEAGTGSGALSVAAQARLLRHRVFAVPGSIRDPLSQGCNQLIRDGANLVQQSSELLSDLKIETIQHVTDVEMPSGKTPPLDNKYEMLLDAAGFEPVDIDVLASRTGWSGHVVASMLLLLELQGRVAPQPGGRYCRLS